MVLLIDHFDSFTQLIADLVRQEGHEVVIKKYSSDLSSHEVFTHIILSPGPGSSSEYPFTKQLLSSIDANLPVLGICLGMQIIADTFSIPQHQTKPIMHGKTSTIQTLDGSRLFGKQARKFTAARYHSYAVQEVNDPLVTTAISNDDEVMAIEHQTLPLFGVQFHPESFMSDHDGNVIKLFLDGTK